MAEPTPPEMLVIAACLPANTTPEGTCTSVVWMPYPQPVLPPLSLADGTLVSFAIISLWAIALKAKLVFRAARPGNY